MPTAISIAGRVRDQTAELASALAGQATSDTTVAWTRRRLGLLRIGGAVIAVNWVRILIIALRLALYEFGLHRPRQAQPAAASRPG